MPLLLDGANYPLERLRSLLAEQREGLEELQAMAESLAADSRLTPGFRRTVGDLLQGALETMRDLGGPGAEPARLADAVNLGYATGLAAIDLMKSHSDLPKVPRARSSPG
ncbi:MAG TPA: hypothetical protein VJQ43_05690 [Thermoplasmata archaeon]|nr:hypothetical protein [Thermoplasmata archaeon]